MCHFMWILYLISAAAAWPRPAPEAVQSWRPEHEWQGERVGPLQRVRSCLLPSSDEELAGHVSVGTFNTYLYRGTAGFEDRKALLIETLRDRKQNEVPDILCLQEVFRRSDAKDIVYAVRESYPYHASFYDLATEDNLFFLRACTLRDLQAFTDCLSRCADEGDCGLHTCEMLVSFPCLNCFGMELRVGELDSLMTCLSIPLNDYIAPYGVLLLSRYPLSDVVAEDFLNRSSNPTVLPRKGYITATVSGYSVLCTHLTPVGFHIPIPYDGPEFYDSYEEQQIDEVRVLLQVVDATKDIILLGDFNHGPAIPGVEWQAPESYGLVTSRGYFSANVMWCGQCTVCVRDNLTMNSLLRASKNKLIDHVYLPVSKAAVVIRVDRIFDSIYTSGQPVYPLSDHYGVKALLDSTRMSHALCPKKEEGLDNDLMF